ncbi:hypothetical protein HID58_005065 [Brassica napus]|uniref:MPN domain-containing protein n=1 Tax=Brassica napus TaxID=3708 RepID=A0ABQ8E7H4_BRANA|nr:hypothetical protein HID58_005065 [Brassica napus]
MGTGTNGELKYEISQNAYIKLVLHSLRHKTAAVNGVLVGRISPNDEGVVEISDSVPLFHSNLPLLPPLEISLIMIEQHYVAQGLSVVGYFHANQRFDDVEVSGVAKNIGDHISRYFPHAPILLLNNKKLEALSQGKDRSPVMQVCILMLRAVRLVAAGTGGSGSLCVRDASKNWRVVGADGGSKLLLKEPSANVVLSDYISSEKWKDVIDFDEHLDDLTKDWLNPGLFN